MSRERDPHAASAGTHLDGKGQLVRAKLLAALEHKRAGRTLDIAGAVQALVRDMAFTTLNRLVALKMLEARQLVQECISSGDASRGYQEFCGFAPGLALLPGGAGYRLYLESLMDELSTEVKVLFDRRDPTGLLWPRRATFDALIEELGNPNLSDVWRDDETIGWVYQYFNSVEERRELREQSQAPRTSRELAIRNQFFTPRYVVQFLVDNTLGRMWIEMTRGQSSLRKEGRCEYLVRPRTELIARSVEPLSSDFESYTPQWLAAAARGDFSQIPPDLRFVDSQEFAQLIDGYDLSGWFGYGELADFANARLSAAEESRQWTGTAVELWLCLFFEHRRYHHYGAFPDDIETLGLLDSLCSAVVAALQNPGAEPVTWLPRRRAKDPRDLRIIDPACGSGHFLLYAFDLLETIYTEAWDDLHGGGEAAPPSAATGRTLREDYATLDDLRRDLPALILRHNLHGVDIDPRCAQIAQLALWMRAQRAWHGAGIARADRPRVRRSNIVIAEPMPGDSALVAEFAATLESDRVAALFKEIIPAFALAGDLGVLLRLERAADDALGRVRKAMPRLEARAKLTSAFLPGFERQEGEQLLLLSDIEIEALFADTKRGLRPELTRFAHAAAGQTGMRRRLFADDALQGLGLLELCEQKYDVVLMNPPFGAGSTAAKKVFEAAYPKTKNDVYAAFVERGIELLHSKGRLGAITSRTGFFLSSFQAWREEILLPKAPPVVFADLGAGVLDAMVETAAYCLEAK